MVVVTCLTAANASLDQADAGEDPNANQVPLRTADGPERPEWFPILGDVLVSCTMGNPNEDGIHDHSCRQQSDIAGDVIAYHPWPAIDLVTREGTPVRASGAGTVLSVGHNTSEYEPDALATDVSDDALAARAGGWIVVGHADGPNSVYKHVAEWFVAPGDAVEPGQVIGLVGYPGAPSAQLHYDEQDEAVRFNEPSARVDFGTMQARGPDGELQTFPTDLGHDDWADVWQGTVIGLHGWDVPTVVASEADLRAAVDDLSQRSADGPFTIEVVADITITGDPLIYTGDELVMIDGDP